MKETNRNKIGELIDNSAIVFRGKKSWDINYKTLKNLRAKPRSAHGVVMLLIKEEFGDVTGCLFCNSWTSDMQTHLRKDSCPNFKAFVANHPVLRSL